MATRSLSERSICGLNTWKLFRPRSFAWYIAVSECLSSSPMVAPSRGNRLTPMLTVATSARPSIMTGALSTSLMRVAAMRDFVGRIDLVEHDDEFVAAHADDDVRGTHRGAHALGDFLQQLVADFVTARVVDVLEAVEVEEQHREHLAVFLPARDRLGQVRLQEQPVRQPGQVIVIGEFVEALLVGEQLCLRFLSLGQVAHQVGHEPAVARFDRHAAHFDVHLPAVLEPLHELDAAARLDARQRRDHRVLRIVRTAQHGQHRAAAQFVQRESELLLHGGIRIDDLAGARVGHQQSVLRLFDDGAVARFERQAVGVEAARARDQQHRDDREAADQQA